MKKIKLSRILSCCSFSGKRLDQVLALLFREYSRSYLKKLIMMNRVFINNIIVNKPNTKILGGEIITIDPILKNNLLNIPQNIFLNIVYEDNDILVINKPSGLVVHPGSGNLKGTIFNALLYRYENIKNVPRAGIIHRLDKDTTGLMVIAKNIFSYNFLLKLLKNRNIIREYQAIVQGRMISGGTIDEPIMRHHSKRTSMTVNLLGKKSITHYKIINRFQFYTHISVRLETGRTHQIRVHMLYIKHPILGDPLYRGVKYNLNFQEKNMINKIFTFPRQALHAYRLAFHHPISKNLMSWTIPLPKDMQELLKYL